MGSSVEVGLARKVLEELYGVLRSGAPVHPRDVRQAVAQKNLEGAEAALQKAAPVIARVSGKGTLHWRTAARKISRLTKQVNALRAAQ